MSRGEVERKQTDPKLVEMYLGGKGIATRLLWDRVPPGVEPFSPDNPLIIAAGLLTGTMVPGANRACIVYKSPVTDSHTYSNVGGFWAAEMKHAGYDFMVISGKSPAPVYLWINDGQVEIRDASHLWGKDTRETQRLIREELGKDKAQILCIGPAGENKVYLSTIEHGNGASASRGGGGAIMGDKNLKAIAVYGTRDVSVANTPKLIELGDQILSRTGPIRTAIFEDYAKTLVQWLADLGSFGNFDEKTLSDLQPYTQNMAKMTQDFVDKARSREVACYNCGLRCKHVYPAPDGGYTFLKCVPWVNPVTSSQIFDCSFILRFHNLCEKYGLDSSSLANILNFAIDLYQKGILTREDTGMHLEWGNDKVILSLMEKIAQRDGVGDVLANGVYRAAQQIGRGAEQYAYHTKKLEMIPSYIIGPHSVFRQMISDKAGDVTRLDSTALTLVWRDSKEEREKLINSGFFSYPKRFEQFFRDGIDLSGQDYEALCQFVAYDEETWTLADCAGICMFWSTFFWLPPIGSRAVLADLIAYATGMDIGETEATKIAKRIVTLVRAYHVRDGLRKKDDVASAPPYTFDRDPPPPYPKLSRQTTEKWVDRFYEIKGLDKEGIPTRQTLQELDLDDVRQDLEQRGILAAEEIKQKDSVLPSP
ncbi:MAG: hypothetical protein HY669_03090 [Chloroflexi bacterium]|nr:hypothetical protein [Chloroflexota bacterium]